MPAQSPEPSSLPHRWIRLIALTTLLLAAGCSDDGPPAVSREASHAQMLALLRDVHTVAENDHPFLGRRQLQNAEQSLRNADPQTTTAQLSLLHALYGRELLRMGQTAEAIAELQESLRLLELGENIDQQALQHLLYQLAVACLRLGEDSNCVHCINGERCLFPISASGKHDDPDGSTQAVHYLQRALVITPDDLRSRWLLNIARMTLGDHPQGMEPDYLIPASPPGSAASPVGAYRNLAEPMGLDQPGWAGGVAVDDFDGDHDLDIFMSSWSTDGPLQWFRNDGDGTFSNQTAAAGLTGITGGLNLLHADFDNDNDLDLLVLRGAWLGEHGRHPNSLIENLGDGRFRDITIAAGLAEQNYPTQTAAWEDFDLDGDLDLFIGNENYFSQLFENDGNGQFHDIAIAAGADLIGFVKGCVAGDFNADGYPDLYISRLLGNNSLLQNNGDFTFSDVAPQLDVTGPVNSFATWFWDLNNDGYLDLYAGSYDWGIQHIAADFLGLPPQAEPDCLYLGEAGGKFRLATKELNYPRVTQPMGANFGDIDNDGFLDFALGTGYVDYEGLMPNLLFHNQQGRGFADITVDSRTGHLQKGHAMAFADLDHDGDQDLIAVMGGWFAGDSFRRAMFANPGSDANSVSVRLRGVESNRYGIGSRVRATFVTGDTSRTIYRWMNTGGSFGSSPLRLHLGIAQATSIKELEVWWPASGTRTIYRDIAAGSHVEIEEGSRTLSVIELTPIELPLPVE